ncbi:MAG TPA: hypothetical protein VFI49_12325 [Rudaea sp.]|nr:hypothetical protein [Rudaea sp.]
MPPDVSLADAVADITVLDALDPMMVRLSRPRWLIEFTPFRMRAGFRPFT